VHSTNSPHIGTIPTLNPSYTVKKVADFPVPRRDCTDQTLPWRGIILVFPARESLVSDILARDGKTTHLFYGVPSPPPSNGWAPFSDYLSSFWRLPSWKGVLFSLTSTLPFPHYLTPSTSYSILQLPHFQPCSMFTPMGYKKMSPVFADH
jgi:hypothetical protein